MIRIIALAAAAALAGALSGPALAEPIVYVAAGTANKVIAIDMATNTMVASYEGVDNPHSLVITPDGEYVIAGSLMEMADERARLYTVHPAHGHVMSALPITGMIHHQAITPDGRHVLSTHPSEGTITSTDLYGEHGVKTLKTGPLPNYVALTADGERAYVSNSGNATISEIDMASWSVMRTMPAGPNPEHIVLSKDEKILYIANAAVGGISALDLATGEIARRYPIGKTVHGLDISDDGSTLFVTEKSDGTFVALDPRTGSRRVVALGPAAYHVETISGTGKVYVSSKDAPLIWSVDQTSLAVEAEITIEGEGHQMAIAKR